MLIERWTEKYRPKTLDEIILPEEHKEMIRTAIINRNLPHLILIGPPGTGKTSLAKVIINELDALPLIINASEERGIDTIRNKVLNFIQVASSKPKIVFLDEADNLTPDAQAVLRNVMETYSDSARFILTGNYDKFIAPIKDRCKVIPFRQVSKDEALGILRKIAFSENVILEKGDELERIVEAFYPSLRKMISTLQDYSLRQEDGSYILKLPENLVRENDELNIDEVIGLLRTGHPYKALRVALEKSGQDIDKVYKSLIKKYIELGDEIASLIVAEFLYRHSFVADKEVNLLACLVAIKNRALPFVLVDGTSQSVNSRTLQQPNNRQVERPIPVAPQQVKREEIPKPVEIPSNPSANTQQFTSQDNRQASKVESTIPNLPAPQQSNTSQIPNLPPPISNQQNSNPIPNLPAPVNNQSIPQLPEANSSQVSSQQPSNKPISSPPPELKALFGKGEDKSLQQQSNLGIISQGENRDDLLDSIERNFGEVEE